MLHLHIHKKIYAHLIVLFLFIVIGIAVAYLLGQDLNWDLLNYHWYNPWALLHHRLNFDIQPAGRLSYVNPLLDLPAYILRNHLQPVYAGMILGGIQAINGWLVFEIAFNLLNKYIRPYVYRFGIALFIGVLSLFGAASVSELGNSMGENLVSLFILASLLLILMSFQASRMRKARLLRLVGYTIGGIAVGLKLTSLIYVLPLLVCGLLIKGSVGTKIRESLWNSIAFVVGIVISGGYWFFHIWHVFGNPIFPFYNGVFQSAYYPNINFADSIWFPTTMWGKLFFAFSFAYLPNDVTRPFFRDPRLAVLFSIIVLVIGYWLLNKLVFRKWPGIGFSRPELVLFGFIIMSYILWEKEFSYYRYLLPVELLSLIAIAVLLYKLIANVRLSTILIVVLLGAITLSTVRFNWGRIPWHSENFGPDLYTQLSVVDGTVLIAPTNPIAFLVPYLPKGDRVISLPAEAELTSAQKNLINKRIQEDTSNHKRFYAIQTSNGSSEASYFERFGFVAKQCRPLDTYVGQYLYKGALQYSVCELHRTFAQ